MKFKDYNLETIAELLTHLAEKESFLSLRGTNFNKEEVKALLLDMALQLKEQNDAVFMNAKEQVSQRELTDNVYKVISKLTPQEEKILFRTFKISA